MPLDENEMDGNEITGREKCSGKLFGIILQQARKMS